LTRREGEYLLTYLSERRVKKEGKGALCWPTRREKKKREGNSRF